MKILIATGIFEPESGGPATLTPKIASRLCEAGWDVTVITYSDKPRYDFDAQYPFRLIRIVRRGNRLVNYSSYFFATLKHLRGADLAYTLDWLAAGLPIAIAAWLRRVPFCVRIGGDYAWERYLETTREPMPLMDYYERGIYRERNVLYSLIYVVLHRARRIAFNTDVQREMYQTFYNLDPKRTLSIYNPVPEQNWAAIHRSGGDRRIVFAGRFVAMKNIPALVRAFASAKLPEYRLVLIGDGPEYAAIGRLVDSLGIRAVTEIRAGMRQKELYEYIKDCRALVLPSWTDISPNQVYEALRLKIPMLVTEENYLSIRDKLPLMIDPRSTEDIAQKLQLVADDTAYASLVEQWNALTFDYDWEREMQAHYRMFEETTGKDGAQIDKGSARN